MSSRVAFPVAITRNRCDIAVGRTRATARYTTTATPPSPLSTPRRSTWSKTARSTRSPPSASAGRFSRHRWAAKNPLYLLGNINDDEPIRNFGPWNGKEDILHEGAQHAAYEWAMGAESANFNY